LLRSEIGELFYITPVHNVRNIATIGILSHNHAARVRHASVALEVIQERRSRIRVSSARMLHDHANLYFCARNPMMYHVIHHNPIADVCILRVSSDVLGLPDVVVADGNASSGSTRFDTPAVGLPLIDFDRVHARFWTHRDDLFEEWEHSRVKAAEVLVPDLLDPRYIIGAYAPTPGVAAAVKAVIGRRDVTVARYPFFEGMGWR
jgi:hypothetical protein